MKIAIVKRPLEEPHCGDLAGFWEHDGKVVLCMIDGLGHGKYAEQAAMAALGFFERHRYEPLLEVFAACDQALHNTRGVAMGVAVAEPAAGTLTYAGIGNTRAMVVGQETTRLLSHYGIVGGGYRTLKTETVPLAPGDLVIMYTDGIEEVIDLSGYGETLRTELRRLAETIIEDWRRATDDAAILVFRNGE
ncbi:MAG: SpoIIE family protein phosphatase [Nitrospiraceae bacterium]|nr:SpoIIE family protein phosphatase [Nitrospiraceae bacterium]